MSWLPMLSARKPNDRDGDYQCIACPAAEQHQHRMRKLSEPARMKAVPPLQR
jgi:hypothetical protein